MIDQSLMVNGRTVVRRAIADWINAAGIPGLQVYPGMLAIDDDEIDSSANAVCHGYVHLPNDDESRLAMGGPYSGVKENDFDIDLVLKYWSSNEDWLSCQEDFDRIIWFVKAQLRTGGRTLGRPDVVLTAGEWTPGIKVQQSEPVAVNGSTYFQHAVIAFQVTEILMNT